MSASPAFAADERKTVLWLGPPAPKPLLLGACEQHGLRLRQIDVDDIEELAPDARALVIPVVRADAAFIKRAKLAVRHCARHGLRAVLVISTDALPPNIPHKAEIDEYFKAYGRLQSSGLQLSGLDYHWTDVAVELARHPVDAGENRGLTIVGVDLGDAEKICLLRRAFHDYRELHLEALDGGKSGARTLRVTEGDVPKSARPLVAKLSTPQKIDRERSGYGLIERGVPTRLYAPLVKERCLSAEQHAIAVYRFLEHCEPLTQRLETAGALFVDHLFAQTLGDLHRPIGQSSALLHDLYGAQAGGLLRWTRDLDEAAAAAHRRGELVPGAVELRALIAELPRVDFKSGTVHGDLHVGNLFVPDASNEAVIIDYGSVRPGGPLLIDPACLEVSLAFTPAFLLPATPPACLTFRALLLDAYRYPLTPASTRHLSGAIGANRTSMIRKVRDIARKLDDNPIGYAIAVAAQLVRFASYNDTASVDDRSMAYELAARLFSDTGVAMHQRRARQLGAP